MVSRRVTADRRKSLADDLRALTTSATLLPGQPIPSLRELAAKYELSMPTVAHEIKPLVDSGILTSVPGVGIFVSQSGSSDRRFLLLRADHHQQSNSGIRDSRIQRGFEERITELGGTCITLEASQLPSLGLPWSKINGVFLCDGKPSAELAAILQRYSLPRVHKAYDVDDADIANVDTVAFDDYQGGRLATLHLLSHQHRKIAFLGFHRGDIPGSNRNWSRSRQRGWFDVMRSAEPDLEPRAFLVPGDVGKSERAAAIALRAARLAAAAIDDFTAVVGADDVTIMALVKALREADVPPARWPAMIGFEGLPAAGPYVLTSIRPSWESLGRAAAELLNDRAESIYQGPGRQYLVPMTLISRMSSVHQWGERAETEGLLSHTM